jgi:hypothetical protein
MIKDQEKTLEYDHFLYFRKYLQAVDDNVKNKPILL